MRSQVHIYSGTVSSVIYEMDNFRIVRLVLDTDQRNPVVAKGSFPAQEVGVGSWVSFEAKWTHTPKYGQQLTVTRSPVPLKSWTDDSVLAALTSQRVGPMTRMRLQIAAKTLKKDLQGILDSGDLSKVEGLSEQEQEHILQRWGSLRTYMDGAAFMAQAGLSPSVVSRVWETFGSSVDELLLEDPWILTRVRGVIFKEADEVACRLGVSLDNPGRYRGAVLSAVQEITTNGNVFASTGQVLYQIQRMIPGEDDQRSQKTADAIRDLIEKKLLVGDKETRPGTVALYSRWHHRLEVTCAELLAQRMKTPLDDSYLKEAYSRVGDVVREAVEEGASLEGTARAALGLWARGRSVDLTETQSRAAVRALTSPVSLLTGLPGTGKTTTLKAVVSILRDSQSPFLLVAPTGIAAKRMESVTRSDASTVHRAFGAKGFRKDEKEKDATYVGVVRDKNKKAKAEASKEGEEWDYGPDNHHPARVVVVDESSMLDLHMLYRVLSATSPECRIVFVGDPYQLPSVGSGDVLRDLVSSGVFPHSHLDQIFRQEGTSGIVLAAHQMHAGVTPQSDEKDFILIPASREIDAADLIVKIATRLYSKRLNFQVLSPRHAGEAGVTALNQRLRLALNPAVAGVAEMRLGGSVVREDDRVMVVKNDYSLGVYNGDVGKITRIDRRAKEIEIKVFEGEGIPDRLVRFPFKDASRSLRLAYAQTVHKSQGQEYDVIVIPVLKSFGHQLLRNLYYTGVTRAKQRVFLVGQRSALAKAVANTKEEVRNTLLADRLRILLGQGATG